MKQSSVGIRLYASESEPTVNNETGYAALNWSEVGEVVDLPEYGPNIQIVESNTLRSGITKKLPGFINYGSLAIGMDRDISNEGQLLLNSSIPTAGTNPKRSFRIKINDTFNEYFRGIVTSSVAAIGSANSMVGFTANTEINTSIIQAISPVGIPNNALTSGADYLTFNGAFLTYSL